MIVVIATSFAIEANAARVKVTFDANGNVIEKTIEAKGEPARAIGRFLESMGNYELQQACADVWRDPHNNKVCNLNIESTPFRTTMHGSGGNPWAGYGYGMGGMGYGDSQRNLAAAYRMQNPGVYMMSQDQATLMYVDAVLERMWTIQVMANIDANSMAVGQVMGNTLQLQGQVNQVQEDRASQPAAVSTPRGDTVDQAKYDALLEELEQVKKDNDELCDLLEKMNERAKEGRR